MKITDLRGGVALFALVSAAGLSGAAMAQSTGSQQLDEVVVTAQKQRQIDGVIAAEQAPKSRTTITQAYIATQAPGQSIIQTLNLTPGFNFTNNDPYGASGGNLRVRGFDGPRISLTWDGMPLNDTGNYAIYTNQTLDPEVIERASVNLGTTDVDSPTASATGGTINYVTRVPSADPHLMLDSSVGSFDFRRIFGMVDTGAFGPWGTRMFIAVSGQQYDKFKGPGDLEKEQFNVRIWQPLGDNGDFISLAAHYNRNRNNFYRNPTLDQWKTLGDSFEESATCVRPTPEMGTVQNEGAGASADCTNYYNLRINPSNTGNIRGQGRFTLAPNLHLTVDPSFQYVLANGGGTTVVSETSPMVQGVLFDPAHPTAHGVDFNGDGDLLDSVRMYTPNTTQTYRYALLSSLIWDLNDHNLLRLAYTLDYGRHTQTGEYTFLDDQGNPLSVFGGKSGYGPTVPTADGSYLRQRDRFSIAELNQIALEYRGRFMDDRLEINAGLRAPFFKRDLNQFCYTQANGFAYCTTQVASPVLPDGHVTFAGSPTEYLPPFTAQKKYDKVLPNFGASFRLTDESQIYASYAEGLSAPRTDDLYSFSIPNVQPETTQSVDVGYRYQTGMVLVSTDAWYTKYKNRIIASFDQDLGISIDRNVGTVDLYGVDFQAGVKPIENLNLYAFGSYTHSEVKDDFQYSATVVVPTAGKQLVETPEWMFGGRAEYKIAGFTLGAQIKYVSSRYSTDVNDESSPAYTVVDADIRYDLAALGHGLQGSWLQLNVTNLFDKDYLGSISSKFTADPTKPYYAGSPTYAVSAPRAIELTLHNEF
jgi:iron complex outermembrane receptor protein